MQAVFDNRFSKFSNRLARAGPKRLNRTNGCSILHVLVNDPKQDGNQSLLYSINLPRSQYCFLFFFAFL